MKKNFLIITFLLFIFIYCTDDPVKPVENSWNADLDYVAKELPERHLNPFTQITSEYFLSEIESLKSKTSELEDYEVYFSLLKIIASIGDAHTNIYPTTYFGFNLFPFSGYWFSDGYYIIMASQEYNNLLGKKLVKVNSHTIEEIFELVKPFIPHENNAQLLNAFPDLLLVAEFLYFINVIDDSQNVNFTFEEIGEFSVNAVSAQIFSQTNFTSLLETLQIDLPLYLQHDSYYWYTYIAEKQTLYFQYNSCRESPEKSFNSFNQDLFSFISNNTVDKLVLDVRNNGGGNSIILRPFINQISQNSALNKHGHLFTIVGRKTFSSAILNTLEMQNSTNSLFFGESTGGKPNHFGEVRNFNLPNHNYSISYSTKHFTYTSEDNPSFYPEYNIELSFQDYINGEDPVLNNILDFK